nr:MobF family relaxase [Acaryochloris marina]
MRTITSDLVSYYEEDESLVDAVDRYYGQAETVSEVDRMTTAIWAGSASVVKKLSKQVKREDLKSLTRGLIPASAKGMAKGAAQRIRGKKPNAEDSERLAHDVTLSAPKSVSMALHLEGDNRLFDAHMEAVLETFELLEREYAQSRIQVNGVRSVVNTGNMIAALIPHHTSRDGDMQLHTHMLIMNGTEGPDGQWRSLSHEKLAKAKWVGSFYRQKLAEKVQRLGYRIYETKHGFELEGYNRADVEVFSKRHRAIVKAVMDEGLAVTPQNKKQKVLTTRQAKRGVGKKLETIQDHWREEAHFQAVGHPVLAGPLAMVSDPDKAKVEVDSAIRHFSEWSSVFEQDDIYTYIFKNIRPEGMAMEQVDEAISQSKELIPVDRGFTTVTAVEEEAQIHQHWMAGQSQAQPMVSTPSLAGMGVKLNDDQAKAVLGTLTSTDRYQIWQGFPGVGKSRSLGALKTLLAASGLVIRGFSPTIPAAINLQDELGIPTNTVEHLVRSQPKAASKQVWLIDESGMISRKQMLKIMNHAERTGARLVFVGDKGQNSAITAGSPFRFMQQNGATTHRIEEIVRQKNPVQKQAVELISNGQGEKALDLLSANDYVIDLGSRGAIVKAAAAQFLALPLAEQDKTLIVAGTNEQRLAAEKEIRKGEKATGRLGESSKIVQLSSRHMSIEQKRRADWYHQGDYLRLLQDYKSTGLTRGQLYKVEKREGKELIVSSLGGRLYRVNPAKFKDKEVYHAQEFDVAVGDKLRWTTTIRENNWINGQQLTVTALDSLNMSVVDREGRSHDVPLTQPLALEYDRVWTSYRSQSATKKRTIIIATNDRTSNQEPFCVDISRQESELTIYTEDLGKLRERVQESNAQENALNLIEETYGNQRTTTSDHDRDDGHERTSATKPTVADTKSRTDDRHSAAKPGAVRREQRTQVPGPGENQHHPDGGQTRSQHFHPGIQGGDGGQEALGHERVDQGTRQIDGQLEDENRGYQRLADDNGRQGVGSRRGDHEGQKQAPPTRPTQDGRSTEWEPAPSDLANWVMQWSEENELSASGLENHLLALANDIESLSQSLEPDSFNGLDELADLVIENQFADALADNLAHISQSIDHIDQAIEKNLSQQRIDSIAEAVVEWRTGQELAEAVAEIADIVAQSDGLDRGILRLLAGLEATQSLDVKFPAMAELVDAVQDWQTEVEVSAVISEVKDWVESLTIPQFPDMDNLAQDVHDLNEEQALAESGLVEQLVSLTTQINELVEPQQMEFEGLDQLTDMVVDLQQGEDLALVQPQIQAITQQIEAFNDRQPTYSFAKIKELADTVNKWRAHESIAQHIGALNDLTLRAQGSLHEFPAMQQLAQEVQSMREIDALANGPVAEQLQDIAQKLADKGMSITPKPKKMIQPKAKPKRLKDQVFWQPDYTGVERPERIDEKHWNEWVDSCIHPDVIAARLQSIKGEQVIERLLGAKIEDIATRRKDGSLKKVRSQYRTKPIQSLIDDRSHPDVLSYQELADGGGWWCDSGVNPLSFETLGPDEKPTTSLYGTFKPNPKTARLDIDKTQKARRKDPQAPPRYRKYENPMGPKRELFERDMAFQPIPDHIAQQILTKYGVMQTQEEKAKGFWYTVYQHPEIPIYRTEGDKKDAALVSQGRVVIGGQGVNIGYRAKDQKDNRLERRVLHPQLDVFAVPGREFRYAHDWDSEQSTVWDVRREMVREAELIEEQGCKTWRIPWDSEQGKGVDDLIGNHGPIAFERADQNAYPMDREIKMHYRGQYTQIKNKLSRENPQHNNDIAIYLIAQGEGDAMDGTRVLMQSDAARELKSPEDKQRYIQGVIHFTHSYQDALYKGRSTKVFERRLFLLQHKSQPTQTVNLDKELEM